ncbi:3-phenylpropionate/cinnamic acid dioxygenase ferredoxin subunit [Paenibacillus solanacearum]|uniref:3-phenylpropionate/cinnamic acid dioxygenase ferredoxin subunit n=1 Tax=Paenibacillus solanacearum TaxID=2048548 RepID=A0A916K436_9BACL|nr:Rieske (2Fe-2S) protein [Paenibacillus solanacearum]CAG7622330.1 3-phenylpropionate/cinnamic acid dioxygenase ferredoxin subunit [Paenibacillus solanacearum]
MSQQPSPQVQALSQSAAPLQRHVVATVSDIPPGAKKIVEAGGRSIGVYNINGQFHALRNVCPHQGAELCKGLVKPLVVSKGPGSFDYEREGEIVRCPWHQWEFDIKTGCMIVDPAMRTKSYEVTVEKFDVSVEEGHVIVHM